MTHGSGTRALLLLLAGMLTTWGCAGNGETPEDQAPAEPQAVEAPEQPQDAPSGNKPTIQAADEASRKAAEEALRTYSAQDQQKIAESNMYYQRALSYRDHNELQKAKEDAAKAVQTWPANQEARKLLDEINQVIVGGRGMYGAGAIAQEQRDVIRVQIEQAQIEITNHIRQGERFYAVREYDDAVKEFEEAEFKIKSIPYDVKAMKDLLPKLTEYLQKTRDARTRFKASLEETKKRAAEVEADTLEQVRRREVIEKIAHMLELAYMSFDQRRFDKTIQLCDEILCIDPHYFVALELKEDAEKSRHREDYYNFLRERVEQWKQLTDADDEAMIPYSETVRFPSAEDWAEISKRMQEATIRGQEGAAEEEDPEILAINKKLDTLKIDVTFENNSLEEIIAYIRERVGLNILIDASVRDSIDLSKQIPFKVRDIPVRNVLKLLLGQYGLDCTVGPDKVVLITTPDKSNGKPVLELHDIRDILVKISDNPGPKVELVGGAANSALAGAAFNIGTEKEPGVSEDQILDLIRENIAPNTWEGEYTLDKTLNQHLIVNHTPKVQREIREFLAKLRSYTGTMVSITARFIAAYDDFLKDVGVNIIDRPPGTGYDITGLGQTDVDESAGAGDVGPGFVTNESARAESYDLRAQTFHSFLNSDPLTGQGFDPFSHRLNNQGGIGIQYRWLGEQSLQAVLRALNKSTKATTLQAPRVTLFNAQRSHIMALNQRPYIQDLDPQMGAAVAAYDPVLGILSEGVVLDVRAIVSNDRRYVTMELRPTMASIEQIRNVNINAIGLGTGGGNSAGPGRIIQLPWMELQKVESTVTVPDRGTLVIMGFKDITMRDNESSVPFLRNIPVLNFFFSRKGKLQERRRLMILVTPEIIDLQETADQRGLK